MGTVDVGGSRASLSLIAAEELGIDYGHVKAVIADTATLGYNDMTDGSRGTFSSSMATISAARNAIEVMRQVDTLVVDKTGTLTEGKPTLSLVETVGDYDEAELLRLAATLEKGSEHPLASAIVNGAADRNLTPGTVDGVDPITGKGVVGVIDG